MFAKKLWCNCFWTLYDEEKVTVQGQPQWTIDNRPTNDSWMITMMKMWQMMSRMTKLLIESARTICTLQLRFRQPSQPFRRSIILLATILKTLLNNKSWMSPCAQICSKNMESAYTSTVMNSLQILTKFEVIWMRWILTLFWQRLMHWLLLENPETMPPWL